MPYLGAFFIHDRQQFECISDHLIARKDITVNNHFCLLGIYFMMNLDGIDGVA